MIAFVSFIVYDLDFIWYKYGYFRFLYYTMAWKLLFISFIYILYMSSEVKRYIIEYFLNPIQALCLFAVFFFFFSLWPWSNHYKNNDIHIMGSGCSYFCSSVNLL